MVNRTSIRPPVRTARVAHVVNQEEGFQALPGLLQVLFRGSPRTYQVTKRFVLDSRHVHGRQISRAKRPYQFRRVAAVGLDPLAGLARNQ
jgi:hypothetical protein